MAELDIFDRQYDPAEPVFMEMGNDLYFDRLARKWWDKSALDARVAAEGKTYGANEVGNFSADYFANHMADFDAPAPVAGGGGAGQQPGGGQQQPPVIPPLDLDLTGLTYPAQTVSVGLTVAGQGAATFTTPAGPYADATAAAAALAPVIQANANVTTAAAALGHITVTGTAATTITTAASAVAPQPQNAPLTGAFTNLGTATATLTIGGGPTATAGAFTISNLQVDGGTAITGLATIAITAGDSLAAAATKVAAALNGKQDGTQAITLSAVANGAAVTITADGGQNIDAGATAAFA